MYRRWKSPAPAPPARVPAALALLAADAEDRPFGVVGEALTAKPAAPAPRPPQPLVIPPPEWAGREGELIAALGQDPDPGPLPNVGDYQPDPPDLRPVETSQPLIRPAIPKPDWRREQIEKARPA